MKTLHLLVLLLALSPSQARPAENPPPSTAILTGQILGVQDSSLRVIITQWIQDDFDTTTKIYSTALKQGTFRFEIPLVALSQFSIARETVALNRNFAGEAALYLQPGDSVHMIIPHLNNPAISEIKFSGRGAEKQVLLQKIGETYSAVLGDDREAPFDPERMLSESVRLKAALAEVLERYKHTVNHEAWNAIRESRMEARIWEFSDSFLTRRVTEETKHLLYRRFRNQLIGNDLDAGLNAHNQMFLTLAKYVGLLDYLLKHNLPFNPDLLKDIPRVYDILSQAYDQHPSRDFILAGYIIHTAKIKGWNPAVQDIARQYHEEFPDTNHFSIELSEMQQRFERISRQSTHLYSFLLNDTTDNTTSFEKFRGKAILLDVMYNGCGGCAMMRPHLEKVEHIFAGKDIVFVSLSVDKTLKSFKKGIGKFSTKTAVPLYTGGLGMSHPFIQYFNIIAYPTLILFDKRGNVVSSRPPRPGTPEGRLQLINLINDVLDQQPGD